MNFPGMATWLTRLVRQDFTVMDDVGRDATATAPALLLVAVSSFLAGLGSWLWWSFEDLPKGGDVFVRSFIIGSLVQVAVWFAWVYIVYTVLAQVFRLQVDLTRLTRSMALAFAPVALSVLVFISILAIPIGVISLAWAFLMSFVAINSAAPTASQAQAIQANLLGFAVFAVVMGILANVAEGTFTPGIAPGIFLFSLN